jgi:electron transport complex protein RnfA
MSSLLLILLSAVLVSLVAIRGIEGWRPFADTVDVYENAVGLAQAHALAIPLVAISTWLLGTLVLEPLQLSYLRTPAFVAVVLAIVSFVEIIVRRAGTRVPARPAFAMLLATNSALLGNALLAPSLAPEFVHILLLAAGATAAFAALLLSAATIYERIRYADVPEPFKEAPITLISIGLMALGCMGFIGLLPE